MQRGQQLAHLGGWRFDLVADELVWSAEVYRIFGVDPAEFRPSLRAFLQLVHPEDRAAVEASYRRAVASGEAYDVVHRVVRPDGSIRQVREKSEELRDSHGKATASFGMVQDITEQRRHEDILAARLRLLQRDDGEPLETFLRATIDEAELLTGSRIGFYHFLEPDQNTISLQTWSTRTLAEMCSATGFDRHYPLERAGVWADCVRQRQPVVHNDYANLQQKRGLPHGHAAIVREVVVPVHRGGQIMALLGVGNKPTDYTDLDVETTSLLADLAWDITARKRAREQRLELERRVLRGQQAESLGVLAGGIAHDFNNLLMVIVGNAELALMDLPPTAPARANLEQILQSSNAAAELTRQMLAYAGRSRFRLERVQVNDLLRQNTSLFRAAVPRHQVLRFELTPLPTPIEADPVHVQQAVANLLTNAVEAIGESAGGITLRTGVVDMTAEQLRYSMIEEQAAAGRFIQIEVADSGCGMDESTLRRLFDPFFSTKFPGRGLGMPAVLGIVRGHRGAIFAASAPGQGTAVRLLFPAAAAMAGAPLVAPAAMPGTAGAVLLVDDEAEVRGICEGMLQRLGYTAVTVADGDAALELVRAGGAFRCVLLDLTMPRKDGLQTCRDLRAMRPDLPVILCSGFSEADAARRFDGDCPAGFLQKPFRLLQLRDTLERVLRAADLH